MAHTRRIFQVIGSYKWEWAVWGWKVTEKLKHQYRCSRNSRWDFVSRKPKLSASGFSADSNMNKDH